MAKFPFSIARKSASISQRWEVNSVDDLYVALGRVSVGKRHSLVGGRSTKTQMALPPAPPSEMKIPSSLPDEIASFLLALRT